MAQLGPEWLPITYIEKGDTMHLALRQSGIRTANRDGVWLSDDPTAANAFIAGYNAATDDAVALASESSQNRGRAKARTSNTDTDAVSLRALIELFNKRDNFNTNRIVELQAAMLAMKASSGAAQNIRDAIPASFLATQTRPRPDAITDYDTIIDNGEADV